MPTFLDPADDMAFEMDQQVGDELGIERFASARNTLERPALVT